MVEAAVRTLSGGASRTALLAATALGCVGIQGSPQERLPPPGPHAITAAVPPAPAGAPRTDRVVLVVLDGVRWQEVFFGVDPLLAGKSGLSSEEVVGPVELAPNLHALAQRGMAIGGPDGAPVVATGPNYVSLPGYTEILTGRAAACQENDCRFHGLPTLLDEFAAAGGPVAAISSWEVLDLAAARDRDAVAITSGRSAGSQLDRFAGDEVGTLLLAEGARSAAWPGHDDYRPDRATAEIAIHHLRSARPRFLFLSLGDADELAHHGDYRGYLAAIRLADATLGRIQAEVGAWGEEGRHVTIAVTTDHGRCADFLSHGRECPESARSFLVAGGGRVPRRGFVGLESPVHLRDLAPTLKALAGLSPAASSASIDEDDGGPLPGAPILAVVAPPPAQVAAR